MARPVMGHGNSVYWITEPMVAMPPRRAAGFSPTMSHAGRIHHDPMTPATTL
ncbi:hypothetical protein [Komagataeibacter sp. FXV3]|uniref:hypothetical protein n=1 Tax=Komagataeibacter sp. FXV3 TaxID=2608998 RepID=UPI00187B1249|nr:hypothetical protein [Komagataeibacter sp. FXV3]